MQKHYFLLDNVHNWPHSGLSVMKADTDPNYGVPVDNMLSHFEEFSYSNFYNTNKAFLLEPRAFKFILNFVHMPQSVKFPMSVEAKKLVQEDPHCFLILMSCLESMIQPLELSKYCAKHKIPLNKVIVLCSNVQAHGQTINGIKYVCINFWESISRFHHQLLPDTFVTKIEDRESQILNASKKFICLNRNVKPHRIWFMYALVKAGMLDAGHISYHLPKIDKDNYEMLCNGHWVLKRIPVNLHKDFAVVNKKQMFPRMLDRLDNEAIIQYHNGPVKFYQDSLFSFVTESESTANFITEKTYKAIVNLHPFFIIGNPDQHALLRARGYETFEGLFGTRQVTNYEEAIEMLDHVDRLDMNVLKQTLIKNYLDKLIHNYNNFFTRKVSWQTIVQEIFDATKR